MKGSPFYRTNYLATGVVKNELSAVALDVMFMPAAQSVQVNFLDVAWKEAVYHTNCAMGNRDMTYRLMDHPWETAKTSSRPGMPAASIVFTAIQRPRSVSSVTYFPALVTSSMDAEMSV